MAIVPNPWMKSPKRTVMKYFPSWPMTWANDSISKILAEIKKNTPTGESLSCWIVRINAYPTFFLHWNRFIYQITHLVMIIMASLSATKNSWIGFPRSRILPMVAPKTTLNMTRPRTFIPSFHWPWILNSVRGTIYSAARQCGDEFEKLNLNIKSSEEDKMHFDFNSEWNLVKSTNWKCTSFLQTYMEF